MGANVDVVAIRDVSASTAYLFVNGQPLAGTAADSATPPACSAAVDVDYFALGFYAAAANQAFDGIIYEAQLFLGALNSADRLALRNGQLPPSLAGSTGADIASGSLVVGRRYLVSGGTSIVCDGLTVVAGAYFIATATTYTETGGTEAVYEAGALVSANLGLGYGATIPDTSTNAATSAGNVGWSWVGQA